MLTCWIVLLFQVFAGSFSTYRLIWAIFFLGGFEHVPVLDMGLWLSFYCSIDYHFLVFRKLFLLMEVGILLATKESCGATFVLNTKCQKTILTTKFESVQFTTVHMLQFQDMSPMDPLVLELVPFF